MVDHIERSKRWTTRQYVKHREAETLEIFIIPFTVRFRPIQTVIAMLCILSYVRKEEPSFPNGHGGQLIHCFPRFRLMR